MEDQIIIEADSEETAKKVQRELADLGINADYLNSDSARSVSFTGAQPQNVSFGAKFGPIELSGDEILKLAKNSKVFVNSFFDAIETFGHRVKLLFIDKNGKRTALTKNDLVKKTQKGLVYDWQKTEL
ncbi:MAG: hypothetical protein ACFFDN_18105 [Candidatus Hodarchaeota archaeon]